MKAARAKTLVERPRPFNTRHPLLPSWPWRDVFTPRAAAKIKQQLDLDPSVEYSITCELRNGLATNPRFMARGTEAAVPMNVGQGRIIFHNHPSGSMYASEG